MINQYSTYKSIYHDSPLITDRQVRQNRKVGQVFLFAAVLLLLTSFGIVKAFASSDDDEWAFESTPAKQIIVTQGETMWSIAKRYKPERMDIRNYIEDMKKLNHKRTSAIQAGELLSIP
ncbi:MULTISPECIES: LysM peptidoglycan-binding domain-containing protein [unclassified Paenibacillus]|uniref:LysM peptidoglycan-binding domain-containing protein n=1 Tax=unclassified Paenibacillus TaxID=185978 RepID=UPI001C11AD95|nr:MULTISPECIES: LysM peptidoglycan-binding domain-containing protein [unclassified Paenibacillus]MBU5443139.1 LysM peptidoglycan-binding domain-containing protein [Paenibacillus sp. MSJ-34]CAH0121151.1 Cell division suppressor protein YneA [Paenibacillus sp. CECT 9249]